MGRLREGWPGVLKGVRGSRDMQELALRVGIEVNPHTSLHPRKPERNLPTTPPPQNPTATHRPEVQ
jgi:hypothetical protein